MTENASAKTQSPAPHSEPVNGNDEQQLRQTSAPQLMCVHTGLSPSVQESLPRMQQKQMGDHVSMSGTEETWQKEQSRSGAHFNFLLQRYRMSPDDSKSRGSTPEIEELEPEQDEPKTKVKKTPSKKAPTGLPERLPT